MIHCLKYTVVDENFPLGSAVNQEQERSEDKPHSSHPIYAKVKRVNRKLELGKTESEKPEIPGQRTDSLSSDGPDCGAILSREVSQSTPNVAGSSTYKYNTNTYMYNQEVPPLPDRNYG